MKRVALAALPLALLTACGGESSTKAVTKTVTAPASTVTQTVTETATETAQAASPSTDESTPTDTSTPSDTPTAESSTTAADSSSGGGELDAAVSSARSYLDTSAFSKQGLIDQLSSSYGDKYPLSIATKAVNSLTDVNWNEQAAKAAKSYLETSPMSCAALKEQLASEYGDKYTAAQAAYGANQTSVCK